MAEVFREGVRHQIFSFIENPGSSRAWEVPCIKDLFELEGISFMEFHACMHGGSRDKVTGLLLNCPALEALALRCDGKRQHRPWSVSRSLTGGWKFDTSLEAEYPQILCGRLARAFAEVYINQGWIASSDPRAVNSSKVAPASWRVAAGRQPRGCGFKQLLSEDGQVIRLHVTSPADIQTVQSGRSDREVTLRNRVFPKQSRMIYHQQANPGGEAGAFSSKKRRYGDEERDEEPILAAAAAASPF